MSRQQERREARLRGAGNRRVQTSAFSISLGPPPVAAENEHQNENERELELENIKGASVTPSGKRRRLDSYTSSSLNNNSNNNPDAAVGNNDKPLSPTQKDEPQFGSQEDARNSNNNNANKPSTPPPRLQPDGYDERNKENTPLPASLENSPEQQNERSRKRPTLPSRTPNKLGLTAPPSIKRSAKKVDSNKLKLLGYDDDNGFSGEGTPVKKVHAMFEQEEEGEKDEEGEGPAQELEPEVEAEVELETIQVEFEKDGNEDEDEDKREEENEEEEQDKMQNDQQQDIAVMDNEQRAEEERENRDEEVMIDIDMDNMEVNNEDQEEGEQELVNEERVNVETSEPHEADANSPDSATEPVEQEGPGDEEIEYTDKETNKFDNDDYDDYDDEEFVPSQPKSKLRRSSQNTNTKSKKRPSTSTAANNEPHKQQSKSKPKPKQNKKKRNTNDDDDDDNVITLTIQKVPTRSGGTNRVNAIDVISQSITEMLESYQDKVSEKWVQNALGQYKDLLSSRFFKLIDAIDTNHGMHQQFKKAESNRNTLRHQLLELRKERQNLQLEMQQVRNQYHHERENNSKLKQVGAFINDIKALRQSVGDDHNNNEELIPVNNADISIIQPIVNQHYGALERLKQLTAKLADIDRTLSY